MRVLHESQGALLHVCPISSLGAALCSRAAAAICAGPGRRVAEPAPRCRRNAVPVAVAIAVAACSAADPHRHLPPAPPPTPFEINVGSPPTDGHSSGVVPKLRCSPWDLHSSRWGIDAASRRDDCWSRRKAEAAVLVNACSARRSRHHRCVANDRSAKDRAACTASRSIRSSIWRPIATSTSYSAPGLAARIAHQPRRPPAARCGAMHGSDRAGQRDREPPCKDVAKRSEEPGAQRRPDRFRPDGTCSSRPANDHDADQCRQRGPVAPRARQGRSHRPRRRRGSRQQPTRADADDARPIWSYGHRNVQGIAFRPSGSSTGDQLGTGRARPAGRRRGEPIARRRQFRLGPRIGLLTAATMAVRRHPCRIGGGVHNAPYTTAARRLGIQLGERAWRRDCSIAAAEFPEGSGTSACRRDLAGKTL